ncbi:CAZyme family GT8 [Agaricus bisporus var. burnettii]|uniref:glycogenin glucosyltransferase n=1 Tax=Agaricus bisporus var. burnettii TaxID=192524 RepID=A0A8H7KKY5_AGABI|nr:CAZyme family GT8 [Agaricus bisporus var. burnettii]
MAGPYASVTLVSSDSYLPGALAQAAALRDLHPQPPVFPELPFQSLCLVTPETVNVSTIKLLRQSFDTVIGVEVLEAEDLANLHLLGRPDLTTVFTKLHVFRLTQYSKILFLDADVLPVRPLSHLFNLSHDFAAAPDVGWPDIFNSGVLVLSPGQDKFDHLISLLKSKGSWDGGDQGLLNEWRGGDWHRLSFTYNTTPTAAYTYAPAYERYGSQINALHFIGPNKPWHSIPFRSPFLAEKRVTARPHTTQQAYDYDSLVDRWFAVYDKHYRSQPILPPSFEVKHYPSVWDSSSSTTRPTEEKQLDLEDLRKLAVEGVNATGFFNGKEGEGEYRTLPLEGRFDLMRPKKPPTESQIEDESPTTGTALPPEPSFMDTERDLPLTPMVQHLDLPDGPRYSQTLTIPGFQASPELGSLSRSLLNASRPTSDYYASSAGPTSESEGGSIAGDLGGMSNRPPHPFAQVSRPIQHSPHSDSDVEAANQQQSVAPISHHHHHHQEHSHSGHIQHGEKSQGGENHTLRPSSPPLVSWNPAVEPPPNKPPPPSAFPIDPYFSNVWDSARNSEFGQSPPTPGHRSDFFEAPPPPKIPETLRAEGHYRNVMGDSVTGPNPLPDLTKVKPVFPWEDKPRQRPGRIFPDSDAPSPARFISPKVAKPSPAPSTLDTRPLKQPPPPRLPKKLSYSNAWDVDPSIQSYAKRLVQPSSAASGGNRWQDWDEKLEASSRDGDDEDNADEDVDVDEYDSDDDRKRRRRSRSSSLIAEETRQVQKSAQKKYRSRGIQTTSVQTRSQSVQVSVLVEERSRRVSQPARSSTATNSVTGKQAGRTSDSHTRSSAPPPPVLPRTRSVSSGSLGIAPSGVATPRQTRRDFITSSTTISPEVSSKPPSQSIFPSQKPGIPKAKPRPQISFPSESAVPIRPFIQTTQQPGNAVLIKQRQISNDSSLGSSLSSVGPISPPDDQPFAPTIRTGTRVWDPARGVESFKRGSEEVLARFLKMGSWDADNR